MLNDFKICHQLFYKLVFNSNIKRSTIQSPGALYGEFTLESLGENKNETRNRNLVRVLEDLQIVENRGSGIPTMIKEMRVLKLEPPVFEEKRGDFWVIFKNHTLMTKEDIEWIKSLGMDLTEDEAIALTFIKKNEKITNGDYQKLSNVNGDKALIDLKRLISKDLISAQAKYINS